jgi:hypothetical protein
MAFRSEQYNFYDPPARLFLVKGSMYGLPVEGLHLFRGDGATMQIKVASLAQVVDAKGPKMNQGETVTLFNDLCLLAAALIDRSTSMGSRRPCGARQLHPPGHHDQRAAPSTSRELTISSRMTVPVQRRHNLPELPLVDAGALPDFDGRRVAGYGETMWHTPEAGSSTASST